MNCFYHNDLNAVAQCQDCSKGLCSECATRYSFPICPSCNEARGGQEKSNIIKELLLTFSVGLLLTMTVGKSMLANHSEQSAILLICMFYAYSGIVSGWYTLNKITPRFFLALPLIGWLIYFCVKLTIACYAGLVMLPVRTIRNVKRLKVINSI